MRFGQVKAALWRTYADVQRKHTMQLAAGLSYYFIMSLFPLLIVFAAAVAYLPVPTCSTKRWPSRVASCRETARGWSGQSCET